MADSLFEQTQPADDADSEVRWFVVMNRSNVVEYLSSGLIVPRVAFSKYYDDVLAFRDDRVPLVRDGAARELLELAAGGRHDFAVLLEVRTDAVVAEPDGEVAAMNVAALDSAVAAHFRTGEELEEFRARVFDNVDHDRLAYRVSPELFDRGGVAPETVRQALDSVTGDGGASAEDLRLADRLGGARLLALQTAPRTAEGLSLVAGWCFGKPSARGRKKAKSPADWLRLGPDLASYRPVKSAGTDERIFLAAAAAFLAVDRSDAWDPSAALARIGELLAADEQITAKAAEKWAEEQTRLSAYLMGDASFTEFRHPEFRVEKALLLALIRGEPMHVVTWLDEDINADPLDMTLAALLVGLAHGRKTISTELRPPALDRRLARREVGDLGLEPPQQEFDVRVAETDDGRELVLEVAGVSALSFDLGRPSAYERLELLDTSSDAVREGLVALAKEHGWTDALRSVLVIRGELNARPVRGGLELSFNGLPEHKVHVDLEKFASQVKEHPSGELADRLEALGG